MEDLERKIWLLWIGVCCSTVTLFGLFVWTLRGRLLSNQHIVEEMRQLVLRDKEIQEGTQQSQLLLVQAVELLRSDLHQSLNDFHDAVLVSDDSQRFRANLLTRVQALERIEAARQHP